MKFQLRSLDGSMIHRASPISSTRYLVEIQRVSTDDGDECMGRKEGQKRIHIIYSIY